MIETNYNKEKFDDIWIEEFKIPTWKDRRGYIYLLVDSVFPDFVKVGTTRDLRKRLVSYNSDKPYPSSRFIAVAKPFVNAYEVEKRILDLLYNNTQPTTFKKEWFLVEHKDYIKMLMEAAEEHFELLEIDDESTEDDDNEIEEDSNE